MTTAQQEPVGQQQDAPAQEQMGPKQDIPVFPQEPAVPQQDAVAAQVDVIVSEQPASVMAPQMEAPATQQLEVNPQPSTSADSQQP